MGINIGTSTTSANEVFVGTESIGEIYVGTELVWQKMIGPSGPFRIRLASGSPNTNTVSYGTVITFEISTQPTDDRPLSEGTYQWYRSSGTGNPVQFGDSGTATSGTALTYDGSYQSNPTFSFNQQIHCIYTDADGNTIDSQSIYYRWTT